MKPDHPAEASKPSQGNKNPPKKDTAAGQTLRIEIAWLRRERQV